MPRQSKWARKNPKRVKIGKQVQQRTQRVKELRKRIQAMVERTSDSPAPAPEAALIMQPSPEAEEGALPLTASDYVSIPAIGSTFIYKTISIMKSIFANGWTPASGLASIQKSTEKALRSAVIVPATTFHGFGKLPPELRLMIWEAGCRIGRVVDIRTRNFGAELQLSLQSVPGTNTYQFHRIFSSAAIPPILLVCRDARAVGLGVYSPAFRAKCIIAPDGMSIIESLPGAYVNWDVDIICPIKKINAFFDSSDGPRMKRFVVEVTSFKSGTQEDFKKFMRRNRRLEELILYTGNGIRYRDLTDGYDGHLPVYDLDRSASVWVDGMKPDCALGELIEAVTDDYYQGRGTRNTFNRVCSAATSVETDIARRVSQGDTALQDWKRPSIKLDLVVLPPRALPPAVTSVRSKNAIK